MHTSSALYNWTQSHLISVLEEMNINPRVVKAISTVDRSSFLPVDMADSAYNDFQIVDKTTGILHESPLDIAKNLDSLDLQEGEVVFEGGTGNGYLSAIISYLIGPSGSLLSIERNLQLLEMARVNIRKFKYDMGFSNVNLIFANLDQIDLSQQKFGKAYLSFAMPTLHEKISASLIDKGRAFFPRTDGKLVIAEKLNLTLFSNRIFGTHNYFGHIVGVE